MDLMLKLCRCVGREPSMYLEVKRLSCDDVLAQKGVIIGERVVVEVVVLFMHL